MKLRIRGNTLRLRLSKPEVAAVGARGWVEDATRFAPGARLTYRLEVGAGEDFRADFADDLVRVRVPSVAAQRWLGEDEVAMRAVQPLDGGETLEILVEKDFECLNPRPGEDAGELFVNPAKSRA